MSTPGIKSLNRVRPMIYGAEVKLTPGSINYVSTSATEVEKMVRPPWLADRKIVIGSEEPPILDRSVTYVVCSEEKRLVEYQTNIIQQEAAQHALDMGDKLLGKLKSMPSATTTASSPKKDFGIPSDDMAAGIKILRDSQLDCASWCNSALEEVVALIYHAVRAEDHPGEHPYHGPVKDGATIPDPVHENFHRAIGDVIAGKVMPKAREQMRDALNRPVPDAPTTASKSKPMPGKAIGFGTQKIGICLP